MLARIAAFEIRYQIRSPLFFISFAPFSLLTFVLVTNDKVSVSVAPANINVHAQIPAGFERHLPGQALATCPPRSSPYR
jgi:hypothetical protein